MFRLVLPLHTDSACPPSVLTAVRRTSALIRARPGWRSRRPRMLALLIVGVRRRKHMMTVPSRTKRLVPRRSAEKVGC